jgi:hypothetical protein
MLSARTSVMAAACAAGDAGVAGPQRGHRPHRGRQADRLPRLPAGQDEVEGPVCRPVSAPLAGRNGSRTSGCHVVCNSSLHWRRTSRAACTCLLTAVCDPGNAGNGDGCMYGRAGLQGASFTQMHATASTCSLLHLMQDAEAAGHHCKLARRGGTVAQQHLDVLVCIHEK